MVYSVVCTMHILWSGMHVWWGCTCIVCTYGVVRMYGVVCMCMQGMVGMHAYSRMYS